MESLAVTFCWLLSLIKSNSRNETRLREEIKNVIGDRSPTLEDKINCHFVMAFISETMRFRSIAPVAIPHICLDDYIHGKFLLIVKIMIFNYATIFHTCIKFNI